MFLHVIAHNLNFCVINGIYIPSTETISRHFSIVLNGIPSLADDYIKVLESKTEYNFLSTLIMFIRRKNHHYLELLSTLIMWPSELFRSDRWHNGG